MFATKVMKRRSSYAIPLQAIQRTDTGYGQRRGSAQPGPGRRLTRGCQMEPASGLIKMNELGNQLQPLFVCQLADRGDACFKTHLAVARFKNDAIVVASLDATVRPQRDGKVHGGSPGMKEVKRPNIYGAPGQVNAGRGGRFNNHSILSGKFPGVSFGLGLWSLSLEL